MKGFAGCASGAWWSQAPAGPHGLPGYCSCSRGACEPGVGLWIPDRVFSLLPLRGAPRLQPAGEHSAPSLSTCPRVLPPPGPQTGGTDESPPSAASNTCLWFSFSCLHVESCLFLSTWSTQVFQNLGLAVANVKRWACFSREALHLRVDMGPCLLCFSVCVPCLQPFEHCLGASWGPRRKAFLQTVWAVLCGHGGLEAPAASWDTWSPPGSGPGSAPPLGTQRTPHPIPRGAGSGMAARLILTWVSYHTLPWGPWASVSPLHSTRS